MEDRGPTFEFSGPARQAVYIVRLMIVKKRYNVPASSRAHSVETRVGKKVGRRTEPGDLRGAGDRGTYCPHKINLDELHLKFFVLRLILSTTLMGYFYLHSALGMG